MKADRNNSISLVAEFPRNVSFLSSPLMTVLQGMNTTIYLILIVLVLIFLGRLIKNTPIENLSQDDCLFLYLIVFVLNIKTGKHLGRIRGN